MNLIISIIALKIHNFTQRPTDIHTKDCSYRGISRNVKLLIQDRTYKELLFYICSLPMFTEPAFFLRRRLAPSAIAYKGYKLQVTKILKLFKHFELPDFW